MNLESAGPRVAVVCDYSLGYLGGAQTALLQEAAALSRAGARIALLSPSPAGVWERVRPDTDPDTDIEHLRTPAGVTLPGLDLPVVVNSARLRSRLTDVFTGHGIEVVHLQSEFGLAAAAVMAARQVGLPVVHTVHTFFWQAPDLAQAVLAGPIRGFHRLVTRLPPTGARLAERPADSALRNMTLTVAGYADLVLSPSAHQAVRLRQAGLHRVEVLPNTVSAIPDARPLTAVHGPLKIIWIGRCTPEKRFLPFVRAAATALDRLGSDRIDITVVGDGPQLHQARSIAQGRAGIAFLGRQDHARIPGLLAQAHLMALTSYGFDNQPMTVVEAVMGLRGVVYCDPALDEGLDGPGIRASPDEDALAETFVALAGDPGRVVAASRSAVTARRAFEPGHHADELIGHYRRVIDTRSR